MNIAILGDSITQGLGKRKLNYVSLLQDKFPEHHVRNFGHTGTTIKYANSLTEQLYQLNPDVIVVFYGSVDAILRPRADKKTSLFKYLPKRYKGNGMLDPRPYYSARPYRKAFQKLESFLRFNVKKLLMRINGASSWVSLDEFSAEYRRFVNAFSHKKLILVSTAIIDDYYFPGSSEHFMKYDQVISDIAAENELCFIDLHEGLGHYPMDAILMADHFHPNEYGYELISKLIGEKIVICGGAET